jgi:hypothetical protein
MTVPKACQSIADELEAAVKVLEEIQSSPNYIDHSGPHPGKPNPGMLREAEAQEARIRQLTGELNACKGEARCRAGSADDVLRYRQAPLVRGLGSSPLLDHAGVPRAQARALLRPGVPTPGRHGRRPSRHHHPDRRRSRSLQPEERASRPADRPARRRALAGRAHEHGHDAVHRRGGNAHERSRRADDRRHDRGSRFRDRFPRPRRGHAHRRRQDRAQTLTPRP